MSGLANDRLSAKGTIGPKIFSFFVYYTPLIGYELVYMAAIIDIICHASPTWDEVIWAKKEAKRIYRRQLILWNPGEPAELSFTIKPYNLGIFEDGDAELLRRTPPPNNESTSTISEATVSSRAETVIYITSK
ncbi:uncharacterized protein OCT59_011280 [Rhizophagus irregularis]|uniref:uncharacterized protein n=1 Tax=Rhizophagus irregularis TaxID=588596 RepID=UPI0033182FA2|nr:hypothetical protein OCT59_011280 [Rhizophagus irregularis]